jgi:hypothetical protein
VTVGVSLLLIAVGAILTWGVEADVEGLDVDAIGVILMIVGLVGFILSMLFWSQWSPVYTRRRTYVEGEPPVRRSYAPRRETIVEEDDLGPGPPGPPAPPPP